MIKVIDKEAREFLKSSSGSSDIPDKVLQKARKAYRQVLEGTGKGNDWLGWRRIAGRHDRDELERIAGHAAEIRRRADVFIVCGIGGSYLGSKAVIEALNDPFSDQAPEIIFAGQHMGGAYLKNLVSWLEKPKENGEPKEVYLNVISKSGSTLETALAFRVLREWMTERYADEAAGRITATTGPEGGVLNRMVREYGYEKFIIPEDVGGRFSVLTPVGLLPVAVAGIDIHSLVSGAESAFRRYEESADDLLEFAALRYYFHTTDKTLDVIGSFEPELEAFTGWIQQLLGESEGKEGKGLFPVPAAYSTDLHSIGQMVQEGQRNLIETFLVVEEDLSGFQVPDAGSDTDGIAYLTGRTFHDINSRALEGTIEAHLNGGVPVFRILLQQLNEENLGELIYFYELFTAVYVYMLEVNPFDQPGVEDYKKAMYRNLGKS